jgi:hypothetical protein
VSEERYVYPLYGATSRVLSSGIKGCAEAPAWPGCSFSYGSIAPGLECVIPSAKDWRFLQPSEATDPDDWWDPEEHLSCACLVISGPLFEGAVLAQQEDAASFADAAASDAVRALRLLKPGWFLDPALSESIRDNGRGSLQRRMGAYRMLFHDEDAASWLPGEEERYRLEAADFAQERTSGDFGATAPTRLQGIFALLRRHREQPVAAVEIALDGFNRSYGRQLSAAQRLTLLAIAFEALVDPWPAAAEAAAARERVQSALAAAGSGDHAAVGDWLCTEVRAARNAVAHGRDPDITKNDLTRLTDLLRALLVQTLESG